MQTLLFSFTVLVSFARFVCLLAAQTLSAVHIIFSLVYSRMCTLALPLEFVFYNIFHIWFLLSLLYSDNFLVT
jgi:hypothetical protein